MDTINKENKLPNISIGIPTRGEISIETTMCLIYAMQKTPCNVHLNFHKGTYIHELRNDIIKEAIDKGADYMMFIDSDMVFDPDGIAKLLSHKKDIVGGMYNMKSLPLVSTIKLEDENGNRLHSTEAQIPDKLFKCYAVPTGFMLIRLEAIKNMKYPFDFDREEDGSLIGEDVNFCIRARKMGLEVWCDPTIKIGHIGTYVY